MGKIIFSVSYEVDPDKRDEYLELMKKVKEQINSSTKQNYSLYEDAERPNLMTEVYFLENENDVEEVKRLKQDNTDSLLNQIDQFIVNQNQVAIRRFNEII